ncbi:hypothetical protein HHK36_009412 [Tetracentron sinense]|uniref:Uncharacterized protein n=1 Tax=Tetracentron sinense TaxID=13715 RepID=A0A834ZLA9_TETSI|nr:hypothetical protein HHK36_009412 [Tetracentron sinense]
MSSTGQQGDMPPSSSSAPRRRGVNKLKRVQEATEPLVVESNTYGQPCNHVECPLARFIGLLIRDPNLVDINVKDWRKVPNDRKEMLYDTICAKFNGLEGPKVKKWVMGKMGDLFCGWRQEIRDSHFDLDMPLHDQYRHFDHRVDPDQWRQYVDYLHTPEANVISKRNKANQGK